MSDRDQKGSEIRNRASSRRERMGKRFDDDKSQQESQSQQHRQTPTTCQAETRNGSQCSNDATDGEYCGKHAPNSAGELTWQFKRVQMHMSEDDRDELFKLQKRIELNEDIDISKKEYEKTVVELITQDESVQEALTERCAEKYADD